MDLGLRMSQGKGVHSLEMTVFDANAVKQPQPNCGVSQHTVHCILDRASP